MRYPRTIIFVDLSGFTSFIQRTDDEQAKAMLKDFREVSRDLASEVGVRIDKFLGDGFMAIAVDQNAGVIFSLELQRRFAERLGELRLRIGITSGDIILFEGGLHRRRSEYGITVVRRSSQLRHSLANRTGSAPSRRDHRGTNWLLLAPWV